jgi:hypothetical protein
MISANSFWQIGSVSSAGSRLKPLLQRFFLVPSLIAVAIDPCAVSVGLVVVRG